jgi:signal peptidase I
MFSAFVTRRRWATVIIFLLLGPFIGMLYLGRGRMALGYFFAGIPAAALPYIAAHFGAPIAPGLLLIWPLHIAGAVHGYAIIKRTAGGRPGALFAKWYVIITLGIILPMVLAHAIRSFLWEPFSIPSGGMRPTLVVGDYLWVSKSTFGYSGFSLSFAPPLFSGRIFGREPERGDIVVFRLPTDESVDYIKRIIGLPGDQIQLRQGLLYINGSLVARERVGTDRDGRGWEIARFAETLPNGRRHLILEQSDDIPADNTRVYEVPAGHYFTLGDNRDGSLDSRFPEVGYIPYENLVGRFEVVFWNSVDRKIRFERRP